MVDPGRATRHGGRGIVALSWLAGLLRRRPARLIGMSLATALTVTVIAALGAFFSSSKARMTTEAIAGVPVDWQVQVTAGTNPGGALLTLGS